MTIREFKQKRRAELFKFFWLRNGRNWRKLIRQQHPEMLRPHATRWLEVLERVAMDEGFKTVPFTVPHFAPYERNFFARLASVLESIYKGSLVGPQMTLGEVLSEWMLWKERKRLRRSDVIPLQLLVIDGVPQGMLNPSRTVFGVGEILRAALDIPIAGPSPPHVESNGGQWPVGFRSVVSARDKNCLVSDYEI